MKEKRMFENYPNVVEVDDLRRMLGESAESWPTAFWLTRRSKASVSDGLTRYPSSASSNT